MARFRWLNNRLGFDNFALHEAVEIADNSALTSLISEAQSIYNEQAEGAVEFLAAITTAESFVSSNSAAEIHQAVADLEDAIYTYKLKNASVEMPLDFTAAIINPSFESGFEGWENNGMATQSNTVFTEKQGALYAEKWVNRGSNVPDVGVQQHLSNLPNGRYKLTAGAGNIQQTASGSTINNSAKAQTGAFIFADDHKTAVDTLKTLTIIFGVFDHEVSIGFKTENATGNWVTLDNFQLAYMGFDLDLTKEYVQSLANDATALLDEKMQADVRIQLNSAIDSATNVLAGETITEEMLATTILYVEAQIKSAEASVAAYAVLQKTIDEANATYADGSGTNADVLNTAIETAVDQSNNFSLSIDAVYTAVKVLSDAIFQYKLDNASGVVPVVHTNANFARGATMIFARGTVTGVAASSLMETGLCYSTSPEPTVKDARSIKTYYSNGTIYCAENLKPSTVYYVRVYAITNGYQVGYGEEIKVITIPKGTVSYTLGSDLTGDNRTRMEEAMSHAVGLLNNISSINGLWLNVHYGSGTPTAEASYGGYMRFGPNPSYQRAGTVLHEIGHTIGVGTHSMWYGPSSPMRETGSRGQWLGTHTTKVMQFIDNNTTSTLGGDHIHMWPYGINGAFEDNGSEMLYISTALIYQALGEDGLPPTGGFTSPSYALELQDETKYYLKSEGASTGLNTSFIVPESTGNIKNLEMTPGKAMANDSAAWTLEYNPVRAHYTFKNVATGRYLSYRTSGYNGISTVSRQTPATTDYFQLMESRVAVSTNSVSTKGYWIIHPEHQLTPACLTANATENMLTSNFNIANTSTSQRFLILSEDEVAQMNLFLGTDVVSNDHLSTIRAYSENQQLHVENIIAPSDLVIYSITGTRILKASNIVESYSTSLPKGIYMVQVNSERQRAVKKVVVK